MSDQKARRIETGKTAGVTRLKAERPALDWTEGRLAALRWHAITTRPGDEALVERLLELRQLVALVPMQQVFRHPNAHVKRKSAVHLPLLPRYVFLGFEGRTRWDVVFGLNDWLGQRIVTAVIGDPAGNAWQMNGAKVAAWLRTNGMVRADALEQHMRTHKEFATGDDVEVMEGPFTGLVGKVRSMSEREARVLLPLFGNPEQEVPIPLANLERSS